MLRIWKFVKVDPSFYKIFVQYSYLQLYVVEQETILFSKMCRNLTTALLSRVIPTVIAISNKHQILTVGLPKMFYLAIYYDNK